MSNVVLVVESEPWLGDQFQHSLESAGFSVSRAFNGYSAIEMVDHHKPAAIILSMMLDGPGALGLLHELQSYTDTGAIPIVICTNIPNLSLDELQPYGVRQLIDSTTMKPDDIPAAVRSVLA